MAKVQCNTVQEAVTPRGQLAEQSPDGSQSGMDMVPVTSGQQQRIQEGEPPWCRAHEEVKSSHKGRQRAPDSDVVLTLCKQVVGWDPLQSARRRAPAGRIFVTCTPQQHSPKSSLQHGHASQRSWVGCGCSGGQRAASCVSCMSSGMRHSSDLLMEEIPASAAPMLFVSRQAIFSLAAAWCGAPSSAAAASSAAIGCSCCLSAGAAVAGVCAAVARAAFSSCSSCWSSEYFCRVAKERHVRDDPASESQKPIQQSCKVHSNIPEICRTVNACYLTGRPACWHHGEASTSTMAAEKHAVNGAKCRMPRLARPHLL